MDEWMLEGSDIPDEENMWICKDLEMRQSILVLKYFVWANWPNVLENAWEPRELFPFPERVQIEQMSYPARLCFEVDILCPTFVQESSQ